MARIRGIKPEFFIDETIGDLEPLDRLLYIGLWCQADKAGRLLDRPRQIRLQVLPYDDHDVDAALDRLQDAGFIRRYEADGKRCIWIPRFTAHQWKTASEGASDLPAHPEETKPKVSATLSGKVSVSDDDMSETSDTERQSAVNAEETRRQLDGNSSQDGELEGDVEGDTRGRDSTPAARRLAPKETPPLSPAFVAWAEKEFGPCDRGLLQSWHETFYDQCRSKAYKYADWVATQRKWFRKDVDDGTITLRPPEVNDGLPPAQDRVQAACWRRWLDVVNDPAQPPREVALAIRRLRDDGYPDMAEMDRREAELIAMARAAAPPRPAAAPVVVQ